MIARVMAGRAEKIRRWIGGGFLGAALAMLIAGETVLKNRLPPTGFVFFWLGCLIFTGLAMIVAIVDFAAQQRHAQEEQRKLVESTLDDIARKKDAQSRKTPRGNSEH